MKRVFWTCIVLLLTAVFAYLSRFWIFAWWGRDGLFGLPSLVPQGGLIGRWLRGTDAAPFELLIWVLGAFLILTWIQKLYDWLGPND